MNQQSKIYGYLEMVGETMVVLASALWLMNRQVMPYVFAAGAVIFILGRFVPKVSFGNDLTMRRLYHQRAFGAVALALTAALMFLPQGYYWGMYVRPTSWVMMFVMFVVIEVYTTFRMSYLEKKRKQ